MKVLWKRIGGLAVRLECLDEQSLPYLDRMFGGRPAPLESERQDAYRIAISHGCEANDDGIDTTVRRDEQGSWLYERPDYWLKLSPDGRDAEIRFYDQAGLRCVMMNWYSAVAAHLNWGLVVHASCVMHQGEAVLFAGYSGAGKTTVAKLSRPRGLLADEASLVKLAPDQPPMVYDSPMRSSLFEPGPVGCAPLRAIYLLKQSPRIQVHRLARSNAFLALLGMIWHWDTDPSSSLQVVRSCRLLTEQVPVYVLEFQKNDLFWEAIS